jgi:hypothetical protein
MFADGLEEGLRGSVRSGWDVGSVARSSVVWDGSGAGNSFVGWDGEPSGDSGAQRPVILQNVNY